VRPIDAAGIKPIAPLLDKIAAIKNANDLQAAINELHAISVQVPFNLLSQPDVHDPQTVIADVGAGGLGLPDRDYYLKPEKRFVDARAGYLVHVAKIFELAGPSSTDAKSAADTVMTFETALAKASLDNVTLRDPNLTDHKMTFAQLQS